MNSFNSSLSIKLISKTLLKHIIYMLDTLYCKFLYLTYLCERYN